MERSASTFSDKGPVIEISHVKKSFGKNHVLTDFNLTVNKGENVVVLGKSGSGKSVLIKCVVGLLEQDEGIIKVLGQDMSQLSHEELDQVRVENWFLISKQCVI